MRPLALIFTPLLVILVLADPAAAAVTDGFKARFTQYFGRGSELTGDRAAFCGSGRIGG